MFARLTTICYEHTNQSSLHLVFQSTNLVSSHSNQLLLVTKSEKVQLVWLQHQHNDQPSSTDPCILFDPQNSIFNTNKYISIHEKKIIKLFFIHLECKYEMDSASGALINYFYFRHRRIFDEFSPIWGLFDILAPK